MTPLIVIDEVYDCAHASDGISRLGTHLRRRAQLFADDWEPMVPARFAAAVWGIATSPAMTPPYARVNAGVWDIDCRQAEEPRTLVAEVQVRIPWPLDVREAAALAGWGDWLHAGSWSEGRAQLFDPVDERRAALFTTTLRVPIGEDLLPWPCPYGSLDVSVAKSAIRVIADQVNEQAGPVVAELRGSDVARAVR
jgi:hypothetical protein